MALLGNLRYFKSFSVATAKVTSWFYSSWSSSTKTLSLKLESPEFKAIITDEVKVLQSIFEENGFEIRIAGGAVRDLLLGIHPKDVDFATTATPEEMKEMFTKNEIRMINMQGEKHGTITPRINDKVNFEVTTLRIDKVTDGRHAQVEYTKDWVLDANRRDLTINSMFLGLDGTVYDYCNGYEDIQKKRVVFVGDAAQRIKEDYLRILRYFRFYGRMAKSNDDHDQQTLAAIKENASGLERISGERIFMELSKIIEGNLGKELLPLILELGIGPYIGLPKVNLPQYQELCHRLMSIKSTVSAITLISGLLDTTDEMLTFHKRCKLSAFQRDLGLFIIQHRDGKVDTKPVRPYQTLVLTSQKPDVTREFVNEMLLYKGELEVLDMFKKWDPPKFPIDGHMIRSHATITDARQIGVLLKRLKAIWINEEFRVSKEDLLKKIPEILNEHVSKKQKTH